MTTSRDTATPEAIAAFGAHYDYDVSYMLQLLDTAPEAYDRFDAFLPLASPVGALPAEAFAVCKLVAYIEQGCGPCAQLAVRMARETGVSAALLRAVIDEAELPPDLADVRAFSQVLLADEHPTEVLATALEQLYGAVGRAELALAVASARVFPALKRGLGFAQPFERASLEV